MSVLVDGASDIEDGQRGNHSEEELRVGDELPRALAPPEPEDHLARVALRVVLGGLDKPLRPEVGGVRVVFGVVRE